jgi:membrane associated rhomboid family serine protease
LDTIILNITQLFNTLRENALSALVIIGLLWGIHLLNILSRKRLNRLGIYPRHIAGLPGIVCSSFLHGGFDHLFFNSVPLFVLLDFMLTTGVQQCLQITLIIIVISGSLTWLFGRRGIHIGASSLIMGYLSYLLVDAYQYPSIKAWALGAICLYYFGSFLFSIFPSEEKTSWEGHLFGLMAGIAAIYLNSIIT